MIEAATIVIDVADILLSKLSRNMHHSYANIRMSLENSYRRGDDSLIPAGIVLRKLAKTAEVKVSLAILATT